MDDLIFFNYFSGKEMLLNDPLEYFICAGVIPDCVGIDDSDGTLSADPEAIDFTSPDMDEALETELVGPLFQIGPGIEPLFLGAAFCDALIAAEEDVSATLSNPQIPSSYLEF